MKNYLAMVAVPVVAAILFSTAGQSLPSSAVALDQDEAMTVQGNGWWQACPAAGPCPAACVAPGGCVVNLGGGCNCAAAGAAGCSMPGATYKVCGAGTWKTWCSNNGAVGGCGLSKVPVAPVPVGGVCPAAGTCNNTAPPSTCIANQC